MKQTRNNQFRIWFTIWIGASIFLFFINKIISPYLDWSIFLIWLGSVVMAIYAWVLDRFEKEEERKAEEISKKTAEILELKQLELERKWKESDYV